MLICWGFLYGCVQAVFYFHTWQFYSSLIFLIVMCCYFKPILNLLLGFIFAIFVVVSHSELFYSYKAYKTSVSDVSDINATVTKVISTNNNTLVELKLLSVNNHKIPFYKTVKAQLAINNEIEGVNSDDYVTIKAKLKSFRSRKNTHTFDSELYAFKEHIYFKGKITEIISIVSRENSLRQSYQNKIWQVFKDKKLNWLFYGLSTGDKSRTPKEVKDHVIKIGVGHVLAISGLHVGIITFLCLYIAKGVVWVVLSSFLKLNFQKNNLNCFYCIVSLITALLYIYLCGFPVSAIRAWLMVAILVFVYLTKRHVTLPKMLSYTLALILFFDPFSLLDPGLYLSFIGFATVILTLQKTRKRKLYSNALIRLFIIQLALLITLAPLSIFYFDGVSIVGLLVNLLVLPLLSSIIFPYIVVCFFLDCIKLNIDFMFIDHMLAVGFDFTAHYFNEYAWLNWSKLSYKTVILFYLSMTLLLNQSLRFISLVPIFALISNSFNVKPAWQVDVLDVGHGTSVLVTSEGQALLYDLGAKYFNFYSLFERVALPEIQARGLTLRHTIISHDDKDHSGGIDELRAFDSFNSLKIFHDGNPLNHCKSQKIKMNQVIIQSIWPIVPMGSDNNNSCVVKITGPGGSILLTGDIEYEAEQLLVQRYQESLKANILLVPHHGSKTSSSEEFLTSVNPDIGVISRNYFSPWALPHREITDRYASKKIKLLDTALSGQITIRFFDDSYKIEGAREQTNFWVNHRERL
ncbi:competence protein ComEC [Pseudoalteromonas phenolica O-BC30]|nr:competence protein ComEC [Pseudoalteromonas phenolica O-BC30]